MSFFNSVFPSRLDENDPIHETSKTSLKIVIQFVTLARPKCLNVKSQISLVLIRILFLFVGQGWTFLFFCLFKLKTFLCIFLGLSSSRFSLSLLAGPICFNLHVKYATLLEFFSCPRLVVFCLPRDRHSFIKARYIHELALFLADSFKDSVLKRLHFAWDDCLKITSSYFTVNAKLTLNTTEIGHQLITPVRWLFRK